MTKFFWFSCWQEGDDAFKDFQWQHYRGKKGGNPKLVVFPYVQLGEEYARLLVDLETTKKALLAQNDLRQYKRLLSRIQEVNKAPKLVQDVLGRA